MDRCGCGCCGGTAVTTPRPSDNRPGLPAVAYRSGTHAAFLETMLARLSSRPELSRLTTRRTDDPAIALLDAWAVVADVLTFHTERIANEGWLGTATEPESLRLLGGLVEHRARPALASSGYLAYTCDAGAVTVIPAGSAAGSVPTQGARPQTFETTTGLASRGDWNTLAVRTTRPDALDPATAANRTRIVLAGTAVQPRTGDRMIVLFGEARRPVRLVVAGARPDFASGRTEVDLVPAAVDAGGLAALRSALREVVANAPRVDGADILATVAAYRRARLTDQQVLAELARRLREGVVLARRAARPETSVWLDGPVTAALDAATAALDALTDAQRLEAPDLDYLRRLARILTCPGKAEPGPECDAAFPFVATTAILPALRRPPSRPPAAAPAGPDRFGPASDVPAAVLGAIDPRLAAVLPRAIARQAVTAPSAASGLALLRLKTRPTLEPVFPTIGVLEGPVPAVADPDPASLLLEGALDAITAGSWLLSEQVGATPTTFLNRVLTVEQRSVQVSPPGSAPVVMAAITAVTLDGPAFVPVDNEVPVAQITVWAAGQDVTLAEVPIDDDVFGDRIALAQSYDGLEPGRLLAVTGERTDIPGTPGISATEIVMLAGVDLAPDPLAGTDTTHPTLLLAAPLAYRYRRATVTISGNVVSAAQGATRTEPLGSGDARQAGQSFPLRQVSAINPLTSLPADEPDGARDTLVVRVDGVAWQEVETLAVLGPDDRAYTTSTAADGTVRVHFGDGLAGARLPTGVENVTAVYRIGAGPAGDVGAGSVTQLASRPLGVNAVTNLQPMTGGTSGDGPVDVRADIPRRSLALDRIVSVRDAEDFTLARAGIGKAAAARLYDGTREIVHLTVAAVDDAPLDPGDDLVVALRRSLRDFGDPHLEVAVAVRELVLLVVSAGIKVLPEYSYDLVEPLVRAAALEALGFAARGLAEPAYPSEAIGAMAAVPGVGYVDLDVFAGIPGSVDPIAAASLSARLDGVAPVAAEPTRHERRIRTVTVDPVTGAPETLTAIALREGTTVDELARLNPGLATVTLPVGGQVVVADGIRPAQLAVLSPDVGSTLTLRRIP